MEQHIRGLKCSVDYYELIDILRFLANKEWSFFAPWCLMDGLNPITNSKGFLDDFSIFEKHNIWELELQCIPHTTEPMIIKTYQDFIGSLCACYVIYFDCGFLELYIKERSVFQQIKEFLVKNRVQDLCIITDDNDTRTQFSAG